MGEVALILTVFIQGVTTGVLVTAILGRRGVLDVGKRPEGD